MGQVIVRNLDDTILERLRERARSGRRPLEQVLREILTKAAQPTPREKLELSRRLRSMSAPGSIDSTAIIRADRDSR